MRQSLEEGISELHVLTLTGVPGHLGRKGRDVWKVKGCPRQWDVLGRETRPHNKQLLLSFLWPSTQGAGGRCGGGGHLKEGEEFMWAHSFQTQSVLEGQMCRQESEAAGHVASMFNSRGMNAGTPLNFSVSPFYVVQDPRPCNTATHG